MLHCKKGVRNSSKVLSREPIGLRIFAGLPAKREANSEDHGPRLEELISHGQAGQAYPNVQPFAVDLVVTEATLTNVAIPFDDHHLNRTGSIGNCEAFGQLQQ